MMRARGFYRLVDRLRTENRGAVIIPFALSVVVLSATIGSAIDFNRWHSARKVTSESLDAAILAGLRTLQMNPGNTQMALDAANAYFVRNIDGKIQFSTNTVQFALADSDTALTATGDAKIEATFLKTIGIDTMTVVSDSGGNMPKAKITSGGQGGSNLEISLVLDVTGSMCDNGTGPCTASVKMDGLKVASNKLIDMVIATNPSTYYTKMAIVPFASQVRVGPDGGGWASMRLLTDLNPVWSGYRSDCLGWTPDGATGINGEVYYGTWTCTGGWQTNHYTSWKIIPCVTDRFYDNTWDMDYTDDQPGSGRWLNSYDGNRMPKSLDSSNTAPTSGLGQTASDPASFWSYNDTGVCWDSAQANEMLPLTSDKTTLKNKISGLEAYGPTAGALGTAWGWYTLSPKWTSMWTGEKRPGDYSDLTQIQPNGKPLLRKVSIIMSDGVYNTYRSWAGADQQQISDYAKQLCTNMKAQGIEIFTVGLALDQLPASERAIAEDTLRSCGTDVSHFYSTLDVVELQQAFQDIAYQLSGITLTR